MIRLAITTGDPTGIGPEITVKALQFYPLRKEICYVVYGTLPEYEDGTKPIRIGSLNEAERTGVIYHLPIEEQSDSGATALKILTQCRDDLRKGDLHGVVTCPVSKHEIRKTQPDFIGHTEFFAENPDNVVMSFWGDVFNIALLTTHMPVCEIGGHLDPEVVIPKLRLIHKAAAEMIEKPRLAILGVNPHSGESGAFGTEEAMLTHSLETLKQEDIVIDGPFPADTFFAAKASQYNMIISAYHDQALIPFKMLHPNSGVNMTLGLPFVRTSVDHGTAFDIVGKGIANEGSLENAIRLAEKKLLSKEISFEPIYNAFAPYYDQYMEHVRYDAWTGLILNQYNKLRKNKPQKVLELACGTANIACRLVKKGISVDACDLATAMVKAASRKPFKPNLFRHDMLDPLPRSGYDLALMMFDSLNYLQSIEQIAPVLNHIHDALLPEGVLIFDITTIRNCRDNFDGFVNIDDDGKCYMVHTSELDENEKTQITRLTFFHNRKLFYTRDDEVHYQRIFPTSIVLDEIAKTPFNLAGIYSIDGPDNLLRTRPRKLDESFDRLFFVLEKA